MPPRKNLDLNIEVDILTAGSISDVVNAILEFLLFQRNQIPFVYNTYKYYVGLWPEIKGGNDGKMEVVANEEPSTSTLHSYQLERQREQAVQTKEAISAMRTLIKQSFDKNVVRCLRFLFGSTTFTAKEAYTIHIPIDSISRLHSHNQHRILHGRLNQTLISLLTSEDLYNIFSHNLCPTNLYLELEILTEPGVLNEPSTKALLLPKDVGPLPPSCKDIHFYLQHTPYPLIDGGLPLNCCKELEVFENIKHLDISDAQSENYDFSATKEKQSAPTWWETDIYVRGFKEKSVKGLNVWAK
ncbi:PREDICTED: uncharacterized protein LOC108381015 isoform X3 [Rhagoletis zephyria]|uniref:uncharacterized protein LOC108381015 isoform X1 n=1 Tax=Rhagoletis zephyria TaxID=28612 RepID=UPI0008119567|nr:PREDICTED: uncharacterized protein LOC108381015 isoform X1 [Rhagoletis zephyria]XP_017492912.1 PREDICTED: uncharacterized protein LOC108381015 isoform X3 [Rhagoletis zephyria]